MISRLLSLTIGASALAITFAAERPFPPAKLDMHPKPVASDSSVKLDYDIVYVRAPRLITGSDGKQRPSAWPEIAHPTNINPGYDLMLLHPDGKEELLVEGGEGSIADPFVSFDAEWVYYAHFYLGKLGTGSDIYKVHVKSKKIVRLTHQESTPNTGCDAFVKTNRPSPPAPLPKGERGDGGPLGRGVWSLGACPRPGGRAVFSSTRAQVRVPRGYPRLAHQLHVMDDPPLPPLGKGGNGGVNVEKIGHINIGSALHPVVLKDGRVMFSTLESQGIHGSIAWGIWAIHP